MDTRYACEIVLNLDFPPTLEDLKSRFRELTMNGEYAHPDRGGSNEGFRTLKEAYDLIEPFCNKTTSKAIYPEELRTVGGYLLKDLGKGFDNITNTVSCDTCEGCGYLKTARLIGDPLSRRICSACGGRGVFYKRAARVRCIRCFGRGLRFGRACFDCFGKGFIERSNADFCHACQGRGVFYMKKTEQIEYHICYPCSGKGQVRVFNPVFQAGGMQVKKKQHNKRPPKKVHTNPFARKE